MLTAFLFLTFGIGMCLIGVLVGRSWRDEFDPPAPLRPPYPLTHVRPTRRWTGTCWHCGKDDVLVQMYADTPLVEAEPHCSGCIRGLVDEDVPGVIA